MEEEEEAVPLLLVAKDEDENKSLLLLVELDNVEDMLSVLVVGNEVTDEVSDDVEEVVVHVVSRLPVEVGETDNVDERLVRVSVVDKVAVVENVSVVEKVSVVENVSVVEKVSVESESLVEDTSFKLHSAGPCLPLSTLAMEVEMQRKARAERRRILRRFEDD